MSVKSSPLLSPFVCVRVVTRGLYPNLVKRTVAANMNTLLDTGLDNFMIQVRSPMKTNNVITIPIWFCRL